MDHFRGGFWEVAMRGHQVLDTTRFSGCIRSTRGGIEVDGRRVPLEEVAVLLVGNRTSLSGGALTMLAKYDVIVLNCDWRGIPDLVAYGWSDNSLIARRHRAQADLSLPRRKAAWQAIVRAKITGQRRNLEVVGASGADKLRRLAKDVRSGDPHNHEAQAARLYWSEYFDDVTFRRVPGARDNLNSMLNYGYTILRGFIIAAVCEAGLSPTLGLWHRSRNNTFALADDLIEPFRPAVDHCVRAIGLGGDLNDSAVKKALVAVASEPLGRSGQTVSTAAYDLASTLARYSEGKLEKLVVPRWRPPASDVATGPEPPNG